jgi:ribonuclease M5
MIKEVIVVEGRDDITAVKKAVEASVISVSGFGINSSTIEKIKEAQKRQGVIVLTDPDYAGEQIRRIIAKRVPGIKHAFITRKEGFKDGDIGVENASREAIIDALSKAKCIETDKREEFTFFDMVECKLTGDKDSKDRREKLGKILGIGYSNASSFLSKLNDFGISKEEFIEGIIKLEEEIHG